MTTQTDTKEYTIDASSRKLGRLASEIATKLLGKHLPEYREYKVMDVRVTVENASEMDISAKKLREKEYVTHSGHPDGQKISSAEEIVNEDGFGILLRHAVRGMLPKNKLQSRRMKRLEISE